MDRGSWWATVHGIVRAGFDLQTKSPGLKKEKNKKIKNIELYCSLKIKPIRVVSIILSIQQNTPGLLQLLRKNASFSQISLAETWLCSGLQ